MYSTSIRPTPVERLARTLGWLSIGMGAAKLMSPNRITRAAGLDGAEAWSPRGLADPLLRALGAREVGNGMAIVSGKRPDALWGRVAGDLVDLGLLATRSRRGSVHAGRLAVAALAVAGLATVDIVCAQRLTARRKPSQRQEADGALRFVHTLAINQPPDACYGFWHQAENLARIMPQLQRVERESERRWRWIAQGAQWSSEITEDDPPNLIAWRSSGGDLDADASIRFLAGPQGRGTLVRWVFRQGSPSAAVRERVAQLIGRDADGEMRAALRRMKQILETGDIIAVAGQPRGSNRPSPARLTSAA